MPAASRQLVLLIHGIESTGEWHPRIASALEPFFDCKSIRYREFHCLGAAKIFFWPWALVLGGILACLAVQHAPVALIGSSSLPIGSLFPTLLVIWAGATVWWSGFSRSLPAFLLALWSLGCLLGWWDYPVQFASWCLARAGLPIFRHDGLDSVALLQFAFLAVWLLVLLYEVSWTGPSWNLALPLALGAVAFGLPWVMGRPLPELCLWLFVAILISFLEIQESKGGAERSRMWALAMHFLPVIALILWWALEGSPFLGYAFALLLLAGGWYEPSLRFGRVEEKVQRQIGTARHGRGRRPHIVAHSLGTFLAGNDFVTFPANLWGRVIFVGGVISERYDWSPLIPTSGYHRVKEVRNEHGGRDWAVWLILLAGRWRRKRGLGTAGRYGLAHGAVPVHDVIDVWSACPLCTAGAWASIHNFGFPLYRHSTAFLVAEHARRFWLPFFWGYIPAEYAEFLDLCECGAEYLEQHDLQNWREKVRRSFATWTWNWSGGCTLAQYVENMLRGAFVMLDGKYPAQSGEARQRIHDRVPRHLCRLVAKALDQQRNPEQSPRDLLWMLEPPKAVARAARKAFRDELERLNAPPPRPPEP
jgi:hypothetical protein